MLYEVITLPGVQALIEEQLVAGDDLQAFRLGVGEELGVDRRVDRVERPIRARHQRAGQRRALIADHADGGAVDQALGARGRRRGVVRHHHLEVGIGCPQRPGQLVLV